MSEAGVAARSRTGAAYRVLRAAIVTGALRPGERLSPATLSARFDLGPTPIREALARLAAENLAIAIEQRGFRVAPLSGAELRELLALRLQFEREALFQSIATGGDAWESGIVSAFHRLSLKSAPYRGMTALALAEWSERHDAFHAALTAGCAAPWLRRFHRVTVEQIERYRAAILRHADLGADYARLEAILAHAAHADLRDAVLARDRAGADRLLTAHIGETAAVFAELFEGQSACLRAAE